MNSKIIIGIVLVILVIGGVIYITQKPSQTAQQPTAQPSTSNVDVNTITIKNFAFNPSVVTVKKGIKVTWINQDSTTHKIKSANFNSADLNQGDKFEFTFATKGSFDYTCAIHPSMSGKIIVE